MALIVAERRLFMAGGESFKSNTPQSLVRRKINFLYFLLSSNIAAGFYCIEKRKFR